MEDKYQSSFWKLQRELLELRRTFEQLQIHAHPPELLVSILYSSLVNAITAAEDIISFLEKDMAVVRNENLFPEWYQACVWKYFRLLETLRISFDFVTSVRDFREFVSEDRIVELKDRLFILLKKSKLFAKRISKGSRIFFSLDKI